MFTHLLSQYFGHSSLRPLQEKIMHSIVEKKDTLALLPTGAGKSLCYQLPALILPGLTIVVSPLLALMRDQVDSLQKRGIGAQRWDSTLDADEERKLLYQLNSGKLKLLYLSPEKATKSEMLPVFSQIPISHICIDEAHCIAQWGWDFRPEYRKLAAWIEAISKDQPRPVISAFTATATRDTAQDIINSLQLHRPQVFATAFQRPNLAYRVTTMRSEAHKREHLLQTLQRWKDSGSGSALVYAATRYETEELSAWLQTYGWKEALAYHAGLQARVREKRQLQFQKASRGLMIATSAFGMGVDKPNIRVVIHHSPPPSLEAYAQEAGRAGRDGLPATAHLLYLPKDLARNWKVQSSQSSAERVEILQDHALRMQAYCESRRCLSEIIQRYFYQPPHTQQASSPCFCSVCSPQETMPSLKVAPTSVAAANFLQLKFLRKTLAKKRNIPPYFLGNDQLLKLIAQTPPQT